MKATWAERALRDTVNQARGIANPRVGAPPTGAVVAVVAPHPDDESIGLGGSIPLLSAGGAEVHLVFCTDGTRSIGALTRPRAAHHRRDEARAAARILGVGQRGLHFLALGDTCLGDAATEPLTAVLAGVAPEVIYLPWPHDPHPDHGVLASVLARCLASLPTVTRVVFYEVSSPLAATHLVDITDTVSTKTAAIGCYRSVGPVDYVRAAEGLARYRSLLAHRGRGFAEALCVLGRDEFLAGFAEGHLVRAGRGHEAEVLVLDEHTVLKRWHDTERAWRARPEVDNMTVARTAGLPVPRFADLEPDSSSFRMERLRGTDLHQLVRQRPWAAWRVGRQLGSMLALVHSRPAPATMADLHARIAERLEPLPGPSAQHARATLRSLPPGDRITHGNFHLGNVMVTERGPVVIDWADAAAGSPEAELAQVLVRYRVVRLRDGRPTPLQHIGAAVLRAVLCRAVWRGYNSARPVNTDLLKTWIAIRALERLTDGHDGEARRLRRLAAQGSTASDLSPQPIGRPR